MPNWSLEPADKIPAGRGILRKLVGSGVWHFHYKSEHGKWTSHSTGHRDKVGAVRWAEAFSLRLTATEFGFARPEHSQVDDRIGPALDRWLEYQCRQNRPYTHRSYQSIVRKLRRFLETKPLIRHLRQITTDVMLAFREWAIGEGNSQVTVDNNLIALRSFFNWAKSQDMITANPVSQQRHGVKVFFDAESPRRDTYIDAEYVALLKKASATDRPIFELLGNTGLRSSEMAMLEWSDIDWSANILHVRRKITHDGNEFVPKDKTDRIVPISKAAHTALLKLKPDPQAGYVVRLPPVKSRTDYFERTFLGRLKLVSGTSGISASKLTLHNFRRFFVSQCADCGIPMATVMDWVGHDEMKMVMRYYRLRDGAAQSAIQRFSAGQGD